ncbi:class I SAM-dependent methyltransferase [Ramlibacter sp. MMS24-I3-19]|uniref:class I SAM-dependent methyltransferase n=1 Tax=Ramlibacter sp. MMS24-I3-19 TaxID=3416606 RepID=UPI003D027709
MAEQIVFEDGAGYEQMMGLWSRLAGQVFLDWLAPPPAQRWLDVGCGNGAFTELVVDRCAPAAVDGIDPSAAQIDFARARPAGRVARFQVGDAMALPFPDASFDVAAMALVIFFVPDPAGAIAEMRRVVRSGGLVCTYAWDMLGGGFPLAPLGRVLKDMGMPAPLPPSVEASRMEALQSLWSAAGLRDIATREITVQRRFDDFEHLWSTSILSASARARIAGMTPAQREEARQRLRASVAPDASGAITCSGRANAIYGTVP